MTVASTLNQISYTGHGVVSEFAIPFKFFQDNEIEVYMVSPVLAETRLTLGNDYSVSGAGEEQGGTLTMTVPPEADEKITVVRVVPMTQEVDYRENEIFPAETQERALDRLTMMIQQHAEKFGRTLTLGITSEDNPDEIIPRIFEAEINAANSACASAESAVSSANQAAEAAARASDSASSASESAASAAEAQAIVDSFTATGETIISPTVRYFRIVTAAEYAAAPSEQKTSPAYLWFITA